MNLEREFSKSFAPEERQKTAEELKAAREKLNPDWHTWKGKGAELQAEPELTRAYETLRKDFIGRIFETKKFLQKRDLFAGLVREKRRETQKQILQAFHERLDRILKEAPLSIEEQNRFLSEKTLKAMNLKEYLTLMKRLSGLFVSHATRYGVREQQLLAAGGGHTTGLGKFMDNFTPILRSHELRSFFSNILTETDYTRGNLTSMIHHYIKMASEYTSRLRGKTETDPDIKKYVVERVMKTLKESETTGPLVPDLSSVHVAANDIQSRYYGAELDYDIYFYFPAEVIAKNYFHKSGFFELKRSLPDDHNDIPIWNRGKGVPIDAGILCLPADIKVDRETGSKYLLDENKQPVLNPKVGAHLKLVQDNETKFREAYDTLRQTREREGEKFYVSEDFQEAAKDFGFEDVKEFQRYCESMPLLNSRYIKRFYQFTRRSYYQTPPPEQLITSKEFWENYFATHSGERPSKIFYYPYTSFTPGGFLDTERQPTPSPSYDPLFAEKQFRDAGELPGYATFLEATLAEVQRVVEKVYDEVTGDQTNSAVT